MSAVSILKQNQESDLGLVLVKFDHQFGPQITANTSTLEHDLLMKLAIKGTSTLMNGLTYNVSNSRRFRGMFQLSDDHFVYGFDLLLMDDDNDGSFTPIILFLVFPINSVSLVGSNIREIELALYRNTQELNSTSGIKPEFERRILAEFHNILL